LDWIEPGDPAIVSFHGDADPVVPYSQGFPFTVGATLPWVYGSAKIYEKTQQLGIHHEFYTYQSALHQLWGAGLEQTWVAGPTEFQVPILNGIRQFLYNQLKPTFTQLNGPENVCAGDEFWYQVPFRAGFRYCWQVQNGQVMQIQNNQIRIRWNNAGTGQVSVREFNRMDFPADSFLVKAVTIHPVPVVSLNAPTQLCAGDTAVLAASGADTYQWTGGNWLSSQSGAQVQAWPVQNVSYSVTGSTSAGCSNSASGNLTVFPSPVAPFITRVGNTLSVPPQYASYQWYLNGNPIPGADGPTVEINGNGVYTVEVANAQGCGAISFPFTVNNLSLTETAGAEWQVFPNPFRDELQINGVEPGHYKIQLIATSGQITWEGEQTAHEGAISIKGLNAAPGSYILLITDAQNSLRLRRMVVLQR
jgi:hypothetical protein